MLEYKLYQRDIKLEFKWNYRIQKTILEFRLFQGLFCPLNQIKIMKVKRNCRRKYLCTVLWIGLSTNKLKSIQSYTKLLYLHSVLMLLCPIKTRRAVRKWIEQDSKTTMKFSLFRDHRFLVYVGELNLYDPKPKYNPLMSEP